MDEIYEVFKISVTTAQQQGEIHTRSKYNAWLKKRVLPVLEEAFQGSKQKRLRELINEIGEIINEQGQDSDIGRTGVSGNIYEDGSRDPVEIEEN